MKTFRAGAMAMAAGLMFTLGGCKHLPGKPGFRPETMRPDQTHGFEILYKTNCSACHGDQGRNGPALPLNNPVYLAWAGHDAMIGIVSNGVPHRPMPAFGPSGGGMLTDRQVEDIVSGMMQHWGQPGALNGASAPSYSPKASGDVAQGKAAFATYCARCHGADGKGVSGGSPKVAGSIVDPSYLALIGRQGLRDIVVAGLPGEDMPDWRGDVAGKPMTDKEVTDVVAWLVSQRTTYPGTFVPPARTHN
ncbi:MAG: c-type cytochrome [Acidobacteriaceae bacterium]